MWNVIKVSSNFAARQQAVTQFNQENRWMKKGIAIANTRYGINYAHSQVCTLSFDYPSLSLSSSFAPLSSSFLSFMLITLQYGVIVNISASDGLVTVTHSGCEIGQVPPSPSPFPLSLPLPSPFSLLLSLSPSFLIIFVRE